MNDTCYWLVGGVAEAPGATVIFLLTGPWKSLWVTFLRVRETFIMADLKNTILNDVLCYVNSARGTLSLEEIVTNASVFYKAETVKSAKDIICKVADERSISRKSCADHPNPASAHVKDIYECFAKIENEGRECPNFVARGFSSFPPSGFGTLAPMLCSLRDELAALRIEVSEVRKNNSNDVRSLNNVQVIAQDVAEIKTLVQRTYTAGSPIERNDVIIEHRSNTQVRGDAASTSENTEPMNLAATGEHVAPNNDTWNIASNRPYSNAVRNNGLAANPARRRQLSQQNTGPRTRVLGLPSDNLPNNSQRPMRTTISGRRVSNSAGIANRSRILDTYVGGCSVNTTQEEISQYCRENGVEIKKCEALPQNNEWVKAYKLSTMAADRVKLLDGEFWPEGIYVRKFFKGKTRS